MNKVIIRSDIAGVFFGELKSQSQCGDKLMVEMINCSRLYESNQKVVTSIDETLTKSNELNKWT